MKPYLWNLAFSADSAAQETLKHRIRGVLTEMQDAGSIANVEFDGGPDWLAVPQRTRPLRAAANRAITPGPAIRE